MTARKPLCPRTLWWVARQADKERPALPMGVYEQAFAAALISTNDTKGNK